jgi:hypothetical protein
MASQIYNEYKRASAAGEIDWDADDIRVVLCMSNTTCDTENDGIVNLADFTTIDKDDGANFAVKACANQAVNKDDANDRAELDADDITWTALGNGTRQLVGALIKKHVDGTDANDLAIAWVEFASAQSPGGSDFTVSWDAEGILQLT